MIELSVYKSRGSFPIQIMDFKQHLVSTNKDFPSTAFWTKNVYVMAIKSKSGPARPYNHALRRASSQSLKDTSFTFSGHYSME